MNTQESLIAFLSWPAEVRAACVQVLEWPSEIRRVCVAAHNAIESKEPAQLSLFDAARKGFQSATVAPVVLGTSQPEPVNAAKCIDGQTLSINQPQGKRPRRRRYIPRHRWTAEEREFLFSEFDTHGIGDPRKLKELAKMFSVSVPAILAQHAKRYKKARAAK